MNLSMLKSLMSVVVGFCFCIFLTGMVRMCSDSSSEEQDGVMTEESEEKITDEKKAVFYKFADCPTHKIISAHHWKVGRLKDKNDLHLNEGKKIRSTYFKKNEDLLKQMPDLVDDDKFVKIKDTKNYKVMDLHYSFPYLVPSAYNLLNEISERFEKKLSEVGIKPHYILVSSILRTMESQSELTHKNINATKATSSHLYGSTFDLSYREFLPLHGKRAPEGYCRHDMLRYPLAEVLSEMREEGKCYVIKETKQACYHITVIKK